jgi:hypothetical protein
VSFECPAEHTERLEELLPSVIVLVIGWRGGASLHKLVPGRHEGYPETTIVGSNPASAKEIGDFLRGDRVVSAWQGDESAT